MMSKLSNVNFKADTAVIPMSYNNRYLTPVQDIGDDEFIIMQNAEQKQAKKKERNKEAWYKTGVIAQAALAVAFCAIAVVSFLSYKLQAGSLGSKGKNSVSQFKKLAKDTIPELSSDSVNPKARDFIKTIKERTGMNEKIAKYAGTKSAEQCVLFHGPSGTGKTFSAKIMANELGAEYAEVDFPKIASPYIGQASKNINKVFDDIAVQAKKEPNKKFLIAFNEIDSMLIPMEKSGTNQSYVLENRTAFLNGLDAVKEFKNVKIVGTTNANPASGNLDLAALSRFGNILSIELPNKKEIISALKWHLRDCEAITKHDFYKKNAQALEKFAEELTDKKFSQRDVEKISEIAKTKFGIDIAKTKDPYSQKFDIKYLKDAMTSKEFVTGSIASGTAEKNTHGAANKYPRLNFWQKLAILFSK